MINLGPRMIEDLACRLCRMISEVSSSTRSAGFSPRMISSLSTSSDWASPRMMVSSLSSLSERIMEDASWPRMIESDSRVSRGLSSSMEVSTSSWTSPRMIDEDCSWLPRMMPTSSEEKVTFVQDFSDLNLIYHQSTKPMPNLFSSWFFFWLGWHLTVLELK